MRKDSKAVLKAGLPTMDTVERKRDCDMAGAMGPWDTVSGKRHRTRGDAMDTLDDLLETQGPRRRAGDPHLASVPEKEIAKENTEWWEPEKRARCYATHASPADLSLDNRGAQ